MSRDFKPIELYLADLDTHEKTGEWIHEAKWTFHENTEEEKVQVEHFAKEIDEILYDYDYYGYQDALTGSREDNVEDIKKTLWNCSEEVEDILKHLKDIEEEIAEEINDCDIEKNRLDECLDLAGKIDDVCNSVKAYIGKHRLWNDEAREDFPKLSFLVSDFETEIYPNYHFCKDESCDVSWNFWKEVEKALDIETKIVYASYLEEDKVPLYEAERKALRDGNPLSALISKATETYFKGEYVDHFYDARDNKCAFIKALREIEQKYYQEWRKAEIESTLSKESVCKSDFLAPTDKRNVSIEQIEHDY